MAEFLSFRELVELITEYFEIALPNSRRTAFDEHLAICPPCRGDVVEIRHTVEAAGTLGEEDIPARAREEMLAVFRDWKTAT